MLTLDFLKHPNWLRMKLSRLIVTILTIAVAATATPSFAATATFLTPRDITEQEAAAVSTSGDASGYLVELNQVFSILLDQPVGTTGSDSISVFTLAPSSGQARATVRIGSYNNGSPQFVSSRIIQAGNSVEIGNLFQRGCGVLGGCDYIEIVTTRTQRNAEGVQVDYIDVNGQVVAVTSPAPEPDIWMLMIAAFVIAAWRLKTLRFGKTSARSPPNNVTLLPGKVLTPLLSKT